MLAGGGDAHLFSEGQPARRAISGLYSRFDEGAEAIHYAPNTHRNRFLPGLFYDPGKGVGAYLLARFALIGNVNRTSISTQGGFVQRL